MKKLIRILLFFSFICRPCHAQDKEKSTLAVSYGILPSEDLISSTLLLFLNTLLGEHRNLTLRYGTFFVTYKNHVTGKFAVGAAIGYNAHADRTAYPFFDRGNKDRQAFTFAGEGTVFWLKREKIQLYSAFGAGVYAKKLLDSNRYNYTTEWGPAMQLSPAGFRFGKDIGAFMEVGFGYKGNVNAGVSVTF